MYRKPRSQSGSGTLDLDSLMDILSCLVGVMLFLVIYTVLELGSAAYEAEVPVFRAPPPGADPVVILATDGALKPVDVRGPLSRLLRGYEILRSAGEIPVFVEQANADTVRDAYFEYRLSFDERYQEFIDPLGPLRLEIRELEGVTGETLRELDEESAYAVLLADLDPSEHWLSFEVDSASVDVFRRAREMGVRQGFTVLWNPDEMDFPFTHRLAGGSLADLLRSRSVQSKPQR